MQNSRPAEELFLEVRSVAAELLGTDPEQLDGSAGLYRTWGWDSLAHVRILSTLERRCLGPLADEEFELLTTIDSLVSYWLRRNEGEVI